VDPTGQSLLKLLFNEGESVCPANSKYGYHSIPLEKALNGPITLVSENKELPTRFCDSSDLILIAINPISGYRNDENVTSLRAFLWEIDVGTIPEQLGYLNYFKVPTSVKVFSGNKSIHAVTVLDEPITDIKTYRYLYQWGLNILTLTDQSCKNPSRCVRIPGAYREPGKKQRLLTIGERVKVKDFIDWLKQYEHLKPQVREKKPFVEGEADYSRLSLWCQGMLKNGITFGRGRNLTWFSLAVDFAKAGYSEDQAVEMLDKRFEEEHDFKEKEFLSAIRSGFNHAQKN
jgi:hypothetical protein